MDTTHTEGRDADLAAPEIQRVIPVIAEALHVERRTLEGAVRVTKRVYEQPVELDETAREEHVVVERVPVGRVVEGPVGVRREGDVTIVPVLEERLVVEKRLVLVEELHLRHETVTRRVPQRVTLRREELVVERLDPRTGAWSVLEAPAAPASATAATPDEASRPAPPDDMHVADGSPAPNATR